MGIRRGFGFNGRFERGRSGLLSLVVATVLAVASLGTVQAGEPVDALDYHATVLNGRVVGSAFLLAKGLAVTNRHVVRDLQPGGAVTLVASGGSGQRTRAMLVAVSTRMDLALLRVEPGFLRRIASRDAPEADGLRVIAAGVDASARRRAMPRLALAGEVIDAQAALAEFGPGLIAQLPGVRHGFSGGPLLDGQGRLVGMVTAIRDGAAPQRAAGSEARRNGKPQAIARTEEAFALRASELRAEALRLLAGS